MPMANIEKYEGFPITFENKNGKMMVNATQMAKPFEGKTVSHWLSNNRTTELIACKSADSGIPTSELVVVVKGGEAVRTWHMASRRPRVTICSVVISKF